jgi:oligogalacturonide lyase
VRSRRWFLSLLPAACFSQTSGKGRLFPSVVVRYPDPATEFPVFRLTDPAYTSHLPAFYGRASSRRGTSVLYASDVTGQMEAFYVDLKSGQARQITEANELDPYSLTLAGNDRGIFYFDGDRLMETVMSSLRSREVYRVAAGFERGVGSSIAEDGQYALAVEKNGAKHRLLLIQIVRGTATTLVEADEEIRDPVQRPRRASALYRRGDGVWLVNFDGRQNRRLRLAEGGTGPALWAPDGHSVLYLNYPADARQLHNLREYTPDSNEDKKLADTSQFVAFGCNSDASVFVGASGSKASPHVLLLARAVKREFTIAEHRADDPRMVAPIFSPNSQRVFFASDRHGKPAIYAMAVDKLVEETEQPSLQ